MKPMGVTIPKKRMDRIILDMTVPIKWESPSHILASGLKRVGLVMLIRRTTTATPKNCCYDRSKQLAGR